MNTPTKKLHSVVGTEAVAIQLQKLDYHPGSEVWIKVDNNQPYRCLVTQDWGLDATQAVNPKDASGNPKLYPEDGNKIWEPTGKHYPNGVEHFQRLANQGHQIFVIPNKVKAGIRAVDVQQCQHIFAEADDHPIPDQWERLQWFTDVTGLVPCLVIYSGGKSLHFYFALTDAIAPEDWQRLQRKIILIFRSDPQIQNLNREMRLAGVSRKDKEVSVDFTSDRSYDPVEFEQRLDSLGFFPHGVTYERWLKARKLLKDKAPDADLLKLLATPEDELFPKPAPRPQPQREFEYNGDTIPLELCLTRDDQELITHGVSAGSVGRNPMGYKLACNAIGTADALTRLGIRHSDNGYQLLEDFCRRCNPPLSDREIQRLWKQAQRNNPKASLTDEQLLKRVSYWQWKQLPPSEAKCSSIINHEQVGAASETEGDRSISRNEWELKFGVGAWLKNRLKRLTRLSNWRKSNKDNTPVSDLVKRDIVVFDPAEDIPSPEDFQGIEPPKIVFKKGQRLMVLARLQAAGWKTAADVSFMGSGKSHEAGLLLPDPEGNAKIWYFDTNHRNPTVGTVEEMVDLQPRHDGMVEIEGKFTPTGQPHLRWPKADETPMTKGNCHRAELFILLKEKGFNPDQSEDNRNPICKTCSFAGQCARSTGDGFGFLYQRQQALKNRRLRANLDSAPSLEDYDYSGDVAFVEEAARVLRGTQTISAWETEIQSLWTTVERQAPEAFSALQSIRFALCDALAGKFNRIEKGINRGADHETLIANLPDPNAIANLPELIEQVIAAMPKVEDLVVEADSVTGVGGKWRAAGETARRYMRREANAETKANLEAAPPNILVHALEVWAGLKQGSLRVFRGKLHATIQDTRHAEILGAMKFTVLLDATGDKRILAKRMGVDANTIIEIEQEMPSLDNLTVVNVNMQGMGSKEISDSCKQRQLTFLEWVTSQHQEQTIKVLANKGDTHLPIDGYWFNDNRASNEFKGADVLVAFQTPRPNLGAIQDEYRTLFGSLDGFDEYYQNLVRSENVQLTGRQRVQLFPNKTFTLYLVGTDQDASYLGHYGIQVINKEAFELCRECGTPGQVTRWKVLEAFASLSAQGAKLTQTAIASAIGVSQGLISQIAAEWGGWASLKKLLAILLGLYRGANNPASLTDEERWMAENYLPGLLDDPPQVAVQEIGEVVRAYGIRKILRILTAATPQTQAKILALVMQALPLGFQSELLIFIEGGG